MNAHALWANDFWLLIHLHALTQIVVIYDYIKEKFRNMTVKSKVFNVLH